MLSKLKEYIQSLTICNNILLSFNEIQKTTFPPKMTTHLKTQAASCYAVRYLKLFLNYKVMLSK